MALAHENLSKLTRLTLSQSGLGFLWPNATGVGLSLKDKRVISFGLKGSTDNIGMTRKGRFLAVEIKIGKDFLKPDQVIFRDNVIKNNGLYYLIRNENDIKEMINDLIRLGA